MGSSVCTVSVLVWEAAGRVTSLPESGGGVGELSALFSDFLAPSFPEPRVLPAPLQNCFHFMSKKKSLETWKWAEELGEHFQCIVAVWGLTFYYV